MVNVPAIGPRVHGLKLGQGGGLLRAIIVHSMPPFCCINLLKMGQV
jgi:hypothetical protein